MKDKEKQIEEMAKIKIGAILEKVNMGDGYADIDRLADEIYHYAVSQDSVVLSKEEYDDLQVGKDFDYGYHEGVKNTEAYYENFELTEARKETAEKIFQRLFEEHDVFNDNDVIMVWQVKDVLKEIAKQFGVEIKED